MWILWLINASCLQLSCNLISLAKEDPRVMANFLTWPSSVSNLTSGWEPAVQLAEIYEDDMLPWVLSIIFYSKV